MAQDATELTVGASGALYAAPAGTTLPDKDDADPLGPLDSAFVDLGLTRPDGVTFRESKSTSKLQAWPTAFPVRVLVTEYEASMSAELYQWSKAIIEKALDGAVAAGTSGFYQFTPTRDGGVRKLSVVLDWQDGANGFRVVVPTCVLGDSAEFNVVRTDAAVLPVTFEAIQETTEPWYLLTNSPDFA